MTYQDWNNGNMAPFRFILLLL